MKCEHNDCFTCPYPDCVIGLHEVCVDPQILAEHRAKRREYDRIYKQKRRKAKKEANANDRH